MNRLLAPLHHRRAALGWHLLLALASVSPGLLAAGLAWWRGPLSAQGWLPALAVAVATGSLVQLVQRLHERACPLGPEGLARENLLQAAHHDPLTALPNRRRMVQELDARIAECRRHSGCLTVFFIDLDNFKAVNDRLGHATGDALLQAFATRLRGAVRETDLAARLGGDEFVVLIDGLAPAAAETIAQVLVERLSQPYALGDHRITASASLGLAGYPADGADGAALLAAADRAMYAVKTAGKGHFRRSDPIPL